MRGGRGADRLAICFLGRFGGSSSSAGFWGSEGCGLPSASEEDAEDTTEGVSANVTTRGAARALGFSAEDEGSGAAATTRGALSRGGEGATFISAVAMEGGVREGVVIEEGVLDGITGAGELAGEALIGVVAALGDGRTGGGVSRTEDSARPGMLRTDGTTVLTPPMWGGGDMPSSETTLAWDETGEFKGEIVGLLSAGGVPDGVGRRLGRGLTLGAKRVLFLSNSNGIKLGYLLSQRQDYLLTPNDVSDDMFKGLFFFW